MSASKFTEPGQLITADTSYLRGHGTLSVDSKLVSASLGTVERINKLVTVKPFRCRYSGNIGDVVIGRIKEVGSKRWRVQTNSKQDSTLLLSSINLPGFIQVRTCCLICRGESRNPMNCRCGSFSTKEKSYV